MNGAGSPPRAATGPQTLRSIAEVERETGVPRATLRIWERRYGFPQPQRDERGERCYDADQVAQLTHMRRLIEQGHRPAKLIAAGAGEIRKLAGAALRELPSRPLPSRPPAWLRLLKSHDVEGLKA